MTSMVQYTHFPCTSRLWYMEVECTVDVEEGFCSSTTEGEESEEVLSVSSSLGSSPNSMGATHFPQGSLESSSKKTATLRWKDWLLSFPESSLSASFSPGRCWEF